MASSTSAARVASFQNVTCRASQRSYRRLAAEILAWDRRNARSSCRSTRYSDEHDGIVVAGLRIVRFRIAGVKFGYGGHRRSSAWNAPLGSLKRRRRAATRRQSLTRRCRVRSWPGANIPGCSRRRRSKQLFRRPMRFRLPATARRGARSSRTGPRRVRQCRGGRLRGRCVGRTSPARHASARLLRIPAENDH